MPETHDVVTCFLRHEGEILLARRSELVSTYPLKWAGISGYVESPDPMRDALREISEETGITRGLTLVRAGAMLSIEDGSHTWHVFPFLFDVAGRDVVTNDETSTHEWVPASAILTRGCVPGLWSAYRRVAPTTEDVSLDRIHGAGRLAEEALQVLRDSAAEAARAEDPKAWMVLASLAERLCATRPAVASVRNRVMAALDRARAEGTARAIETEAHRGIAMGHAAESGAARTAAGIIAGHRILTLSTSDTVNEAVRAADPPPRSIIVGASEPGGEGHASAIAWHESGLAVSRVPDAAIASIIMAGDVDLVLVGADTILLSGDLVNKVGTLAAALAAREAGVPVYAAASVDKIRQDDRVDLEAIPPAAIFPGDRSTVPSTSTRFDRTPGHLVAAYCTELGLMAPGDIATRFPLQP